MVIKVISGGQTGADQAGLRAAKACGIATGGMMPKGFRTHNGPDKALAEEFGLREHNSPSYNMRTSVNARDSDGTVRFARRFMSAGEKCTLRYIELFNKPHIDVHINRPIDPSEMKKWLEENKIGVLNVAGNSEMTCPGIEKFVTDYLLQVFG